MSKHTYSRTYLISRASSYNFSKKINVGFLLLSLLLQSQYKRESIFLQKEDRLSFCIEICTENIYFNYCFIQNLKVIFAYFEKCESCLHKNFHRALYLAINQKNWNKSQWTYSRWCRSFTLERKLAPCKSTHTQWGEFAYLVTDLHLLFQKICVALILCLIILKWNPALVKYIKTH